mmetsp:Transcript_62797/g.99717  ORF Transcript_62797/g.99717 Transcript_62797/m.99717 type:complete len:807 (-) Transcript_62797:88-2508(-)
MSQYPPFGNFYAHNKQRKSLSLGLTQSCSDPASSPSCHSPAFFTSFDPPAPAVLSYCRHDSDDEDEDVFPEAVSWNDQHEPEHPQQADANKPSGNLNTERRASGSSTMSTESTVSGSDTSTSFSAWDLNEDLIALSDEELLQTPSSYNSKEAVITPTPNAAKNGVASELSPLQEGAMEEEVSYETGSDESDHEESPKHAESHSAEAVEPELEVDETQISSDLVPACNDTIPDGPALLQCTAQDDEADDEDEEEDAAENDKLPTCAPTIGNEPSSLHVANDTADDEVLPTHTPHLGCSSSSFEMHALPPLPSEHDVCVAECALLHKPVNYEDICDDLLMSYEWQTAIPNENNYSARYSNFQREVMNNEYFKLNAGDFNDVLKKCQFIRSRWLGEKIRSTRPGRLGRSAWKAGEKITELDLFAIKLYTDFECGQRELKKCYRPPLQGSESEYLQYEQRLCHFSHWRRLLKVAILKYGTLLKRRVFYHGINQIMKLNMHPTHRCMGPLSATEDAEIARGFATKHGFILKMCSKYPRLGTDYFFDASPISAYPDEKEYLIGFVYTRILHVELGCTKFPSIEELETDDLLQKLMCFIISSLVKNHLYSYCQHLELLFKALFIKNEERHYEDDELMDRLFQHMNEEERQSAVKKVREISAMIPDFIAAKFRKVRDEQRVLKLDTISPGMECMFYDEASVQNDVYQTKHVSLPQIHKYNRNICELHLYEDYTIDDSFISHFLAFNQRQPDHQLVAIRLFKYSHEGPSEQFQCKRSISSANVSKLHSIGWCIYEHHDAKCYKFSLKKQETCSAQ